MSALFIELYVSADDAQPAGRRALAMLTVETMKRGVPTGVSVVMPFYAETADAARDKADAWLKAEQTRHAEIRAKAETAERKRADERTARRSAPLAVEATR